MSRIGKKPIEVPAGVTITVQAGNEVVVKGPKGELRQVMNPDITLEVSDNQVQINRPSDQIQHRAQHGLYRALVANMIKGVTDGFSKKLELVGVGFKAANQGNILDLALGYSHNIIMEIPKELKLNTETLKGSNPTITLEGSDKQLLGQVAAKIRSLRKPEPYKGKGVKYIDEYIRRKAGKAAGK
ncbi:MAG TPA: 50S ribosomal protein L6 [Chitinophagaceae bacterium]|nr:50S ribosomal protein L6 [Chitinophagaceae bacterium]